ncbi:hypothetical protein PQR63_15095 [Herbaspirillum rhizosphaerae]|uniref:Uncharacterized protein n=1 Tax=Herbaspirillum rhizosphaerae TaxID=346179 RepID=A0ABW8ZB33_9BURK
MIEFLEKEYKEYKECKAKNAKDGKTRTKEAGTDLARIDRIGKVEFNNDNIQFF